MLNKKDIIKLRDFFDCEDWQYHIDSSMEDGQHLHFDKEFQRDWQVVQGWAEALRFVSKMNSLKEVDLRTIKKEYEKLLRAPEHSDLKCSL